MTKSKLWLLLKTQMRAAWGQRRQTERTNGNGQAPGKKPQWGGGQKTASYGVLMGIVGALIVFMAFMMCYGMALLLEPSGLLYVIPALMMMAASVMCLVTTIYKVNGTLFGFKGYDLAMSLPVKTSTVITSRMLILYSMNILFTLAAMGPATVVYAMFAPVGPVYWVVSIISMLITPMVPIVIATVIGSLIAIAASHFKRKTGASVILTVAFMLLWFVFCFNMGNFITGIAAVGESLVKTISAIYPLTGVYTKAVVDMDALSVLIFWGVSIAIYALFVWIVGKNFKRMNAAITTVRARSDYKMEQLSQSTPKKALFKKEWKRFTGSSPYFLNAAIGAILLLVLCALVLIFGQGIVERLVGVYVPDDAASASISASIANYFPFIMGFFLVITAPAASSISMEGKSLWIAKSLPVRTKDILAAKLNVNLLLAGLAAVAGAAMLCIALKPTVPQAVMLFLLPLAYAGFVSVFGLKLNLNKPRLDWDSEVQAVKQSMPVMVVTFVGMAITVAPGIVAIFFGAPVVYLTTAVLAVWAVLLYRGIMTKGIRQFDELEA